jgi:hypothetical protein
MRAVRLLVLAAALLAVGLMAALLSGPAYAADLSDRLKKVEARLAAAQDQLGKAASQVERDKLLRRLNALQAKRERVLAKAEKRGIDLGKSRQSGKSRQRRHDLHETGNYGLHATLDNTWKPPSECTVTGQVMLCGYTKTTVNPHGDSLLPTHGLPNGMFIVGGTWEDTNGKVWTRYMTAAEKEKRDTTPSTIDPADASTHPTTNFAAFDALMGHLRKFGEATTQAAKRSHQAQAIVALRKYRQFGGDFYNWGGVASGYHDAVLCRDAYRGIAPCP